MPSTRKSFDYVLVLFFSFSFGGLSYSLKRHPVVLLSEETHHTQVVSSKGMANKVGII